MKQQLTQPLIIFPLCSLKTAGILVLTGSLFLTLAFFLTIPVSAIKFNINVNVFLQPLLLHLFIFIASVLSVLPILCFYQKKIIALNLTSMPSTYKLSLMILPSFSSMLWASIQIWNNDFTLKHIIFSASQATIFMLVFSNIWLYMYRPPLLIVAELEESDLQHLGAAIRPHFFFNALNAVMGLIRIEPKRAEAILQDTAELFRSIMNQHQQRLVSLAVELETCKQYTRIEQARLEERLILNWQIDFSLLAVSLPPFCLQPLIENAIRHGIEPLLDGGVVTIKIQRKTAYLVLKVSNPIKHSYLDQVKNNSQHNGMALNNIKARLRLMYDDAAIFEYGVVNHCYQAKIILPLEFN
jgi:two-component system sensor histidine kinase AlgZ